ncbi:MULTISPECIES: MerR family transcriptional regulator [unclassified Streptomyces]|uniref:MerR family transcriptional regulator n=1 Tax=unclassified Streptomyces TaxID=2593676 RepID=UPI0011E6E11A|nr:MerR family transcriptional regulator [Streptomyces sp. sk2.1]TXS79630.1 MerR family DNA-binding transcriptional regulator [Streptomyces sp. sk2.1]
MTFGSDRRFTVGGATACRIPQPVERAGVPATALRFHEDAGLLPADRTPSGYRVYGEGAVERPAFISSAKMLGSALEEIRELLDVREEGVCASVRARMLPLVTDRTMETDGRISGLRAFSAHLAAVHAELSGPAAAGACGPGCGCATTGAPATGPVPMMPSPTRLDRVMESWRDAPVARTPGDTEMDERTEQWRALIGKAEQREEIPDGIRLSFRAGAELAVAVPALASAEQVRRCSLPSSGSRPPNWSGPCATAASCRPRWW